LIFYSTLETLFGIWNLIFVILRTQISKLKTLLLIRHAKSSWDDAGLSDYERPLNERGKKDAPAMAERLYERGIKIDAFVTSPARRARKTAEIFAKRYKKEKDELVLKTELYMASDEAFNSVVEKLHDDFDCVAVFSHNPGITDFANSLTDDIRIDNIPTCGIFAISIEARKWNKFKEAKKKFLFFDYPKALVQ
jgi:phosphohistidine phosphatase